MKKPLEELNRLLEINTNEPFNLEEKLESMREEEEEERILKLFDEIINLPFKAKCKALDAIWKTSMRVDPNQFDNKRRIILKKVQQDMDKIKKEKTAEAHVVGIPVDPGAANGHRRTRAPAP